MRALWIIAIAISLAASQASAQGVDQNTRQQIEKVIAAYHENWNKHDAAGIAGLYTNDGVLVTDRTAGSKKGRQEIEQYYTDLFNRISHNDSATVDEIFPLGSNAAITVGEYHLSGQGQNGPIKADGHYTTVDVLEGVHGKSGSWRLSRTRRPPNDLLSYAQTELRR